MPEEEMVPQARNMQIACPTSPSQTDIVLTMKALSARSNQLKELERLALMQMKELEETGLSGQPLFPPGLPSLRHTGYMSSLVAEKLQISAQKSYGPLVEALGSEPSEPSEPSELSPSECQKPMLFWL